MLFTCSCSRNCCRNWICNGDIIPISNGINSICIWYCRGRSTNDWNTAILFLTECVITNNFYKARSKKFCSKIHNSQNKPVFHQHMTKMMHCLDIFLYFQLNSRLEFLNLHQLTISAKNTYEPKKSEKTICTNLINFISTYLPWFGHHSIHDNY